MKIISKGKYTNKPYKCENCDCEVEIDSEDIIVNENYDIFIGIKRIITYICPECKREIIINIERDDNYSENNN